MLKQILCGATLLCAAGLSNAAIIVQTFTVDRQVTDFTDTVIFDLFDDEGGTLFLESVEFSLLARSSGSVSVENRNANATRITATLSTDIELVDLLGSALVVAAPTISRSETLAAYDGVTDFDGPSGVEFLNLRTDDFESALFTDSMTLMTYTGMGTTSVDFVATATSRVDGGGNLSTSIDTFASGDVSVIYTYRVVPVDVAAPTHVALLGLGLLAFAGMRKAKK